MLMCRIFLTLMESIFLLYKKYPAAFVRCGTLCEYYTKKAMKQQ